MEVFNLIRAWATERNLDTADRIRQSVKLTEELGELLEGVEKGSREEIIDAIGDAFVVLTIMYQQIGKRFEDEVNLQFIIDSYSETFPESSLIKFIGIDNGRIASALAKQKEDKLQNAVYNLVENLSDFATLNGATILQCVEASYAQIKDRKGNTVNGIFVKEA